MAALKLPGLQRLLESQTLSTSQATAGVILEITQDYSQLSAESGPPLVSGMLVRAEIEGAPSASWVVPERALHGNKIYLFKDKKLVILPVKVQYRRDQQVVIEGEIQQGDKLILNDLLPAIPGMALKLEEHKQEDEA